MALVNYINNGVNALYRANQPDDTALPFYDLTTNRFANSVLTYDETSLTANIGSIASFNDNNGRVLLGYSTASNSYISIDSIGNIMTIAASSLSIQNTTLSNTSGGSSGKHLSLSINGTSYKIALLLP